MTTISIGQRFTRWEVVAKAESKPGYKPGQGAIHRWLCRCDCGTERAVLAASLTAGKSQSCGCLRSEQIGSRSVTHGMSETTEYRIWRSMRTRCTNPNANSYPLYGGRGIRICDQWESFDVFLADMGRRPSPGHTLDRVDNDGPYSPENCRWATRSEQSRNTRRVTWVEFQGETFCFTDACRRAGLDRGTVHKRIRLGWPADQWFIPSTRS